MCGSFLLLDFCGANDIMIFEYGDAMLFRILVVDRYVYMAETKKEVSACVRKAIRKISSCS